MADRKVVQRALLGGVAVAGAAAWTMAPRSFNDKRRNFVPAIPDVWYAHRGLHDAGSGLTAEYAAESGEYVALARRMALCAGYGTPDLTTPIAPENSLASFAAACEAGFGIELDIQLTGDGQVVVIHDPDLLRVAGDSRRIEDLTYDELTHIPLFSAPSRPGDAVVNSPEGAEQVFEKAVLPAAMRGTYTPPSSYYQHVPLFSDALKVVAGRAPLIVEYKFDGYHWDERDEELMSKGDALLEAYNGQYVIESFNPLAVNWYRRHRPQVCRGQLAETSAFGQFDIAQWIAGKMVFNFLSRPDFIAYDWRGGSSPQLKLTRAMGAVPVSWTVRSRGELAQADPWFDHHIFEAFVPQD